MNINERIKSVFCSVLNMDQIDEHISQTNCPIWDSMRHLNLIVELESEFGVEFEPEEIVDMKNYNQIQRILEMKLQSKKE